MSSRIARLALLLVLVIAGCSSMAQAAPINLVANGDFDAGAVGFESDYARVDEVSMAMWPEGVYTVARSAMLVHPLWEVGGDHTTGSGNFMLVNGSVDGSKTVYSTTVQTTVGHTYDASAWAKNLCCKAGNETLLGPELSFYIDGRKVGGGFTDGAGVWQSIAASFMAFAESTLLEIRDDVTLYSGNDFGLDDIAIIDRTGDVDQPAVPDVNPLLALGSGLLGYAGLMRRGRKVRE